MPSKQDKRFKMTNNSTTTILMDLLHDNGHDDDVDGLTFHGLDPKYFFIFFIFVFACTISINFFVKRSLSNANDDRRLDWESNVNGSNNEGTTLSNDDRILLYTKIFKKKRNLLTLESKHIVQKGKPTNDEFVESN